jgi:hypothetical protein
MSNIPPEFWDPNNIIVRGPRFGAGMLCVPRSDQDGVTLGGSLEKLNASQPRIKRSFRIVAPECVEPTKIVRIYPNTHVGDSKLTTPVSLFDFLPKPINPKEKLSYATVVETKNVINIPIEFL